MRRVGRGKKSKCGASSPLNEALANSLECGCSAPPCNWHSDLYSHRKAALSAALQGARPPPKKNQSIALVLYWRRWDSLRQPLAALRPGFRCLAASLNPSHPHASETLHSLSSKKKPEHCSGFVLEEVGFEPTIRG